MPRRTRMYLPHHPYHIVQRGNNRQPCFYDAEDYQHYLELWETRSRRYRLSVHAYCLMTNHVHFLVTSETEPGISATMQVVGSCYAQYMNRKYRRTGTLWEGRHRSSLVQTEDYLFRCMRYIELNPVRAGMVLHPEEHCWSSYGMNARGEDGWVRAHAEYVRLGQTREERCCAYRELFRTKLSETDLNLIRKATQYNQPVGNRNFRVAIEAKYGVKLGQAHRGRPRKAEAETG